MKNAPAAHTDDNEGDLVEPGRLGECAQVVSDGQVGPTMCVSVRSAIAAEERVDPDMPESVQVEERDQPRRAYHPRG
jgi:hypothetical protein